MIGRPTSRFGASEVVFAVARRNKRLAPVRTYCCRSHLPRNRVIVQRRRRRRRVLTRTFGLPDIIYLRRRRRRDLTQINGVVRLTAALFFTRFSVHKSFVASVHGFVIRPRRQTVEVDSAPRLSDDGDRGVDKSDLANARAVCYSADDYIQYIFIYIYIYIVLLSRLLLLFTVAYADRLWRFSSTARQFSSVTRHIKSRVYLFADFQSQARCPCIIISCTGGTPQ